MNHSRDDVGVMLPRSLDAPGYRAGRREQAIIAARRLVQSEAPESDAHIVAQAFLREVGAREVA